MKVWEEKLDTKLATLTSSINLNTDQSVETTTKILKHQATNIRTLVGSMALEFQLSNQHMQGLVNNLPQGTSTSNKLIGSHAHLQAPPRFPQAPNALTTSNEATTTLINGSQIKPHQWLLCLVFCVFVLFINKELNLFLWSTLIIPQYIWTQKHTPQISPTSHSHPFLQISQILKSPSNQHFQNHYYPHCTYEPSCTTNKK